MPTLPSDSKRPVANSEATPPGATPPVLMVTGCGQLDPETEHLARDLFARWRVGAVRADQFAPDLIGDDTAVVVVDARDADSGRRVLDALASAGHEATAVVLADEAAGRDLRGYETRGLRLRCLARAGSREALLAEVGGAIQRHAHGARARERQPRLYLVRASEAVESFFKTLYRMPYEFDVRGPDDAGFPFRIVPKGLDAAPETIVFEAPQAPASLRLAPGQPVRFSIVAFGASFLFETEVVAVAGDRVSCRLPGRLYHRVRRAAPRVACPETPACLITLRDAEGGEVVRRVLDLSATGCAFVHEGPVPRTWRADRATLHLPGEGDVVVALRPVGARDGAVPALAAAFTHVRERDRRRIARWLLRVQFPRLRERAQVDGRAVWDVFRASGYLSLDGHCNDQPPRAGWERLAFAGDDLSKDLVWVGESGPVGHVSCTRVHDATWLLHQYAVQMAGKDGEAARHDLYEAVFAFVASRVGDGTHAIAYYSPDKRWHQLFFGTFSRALGDPRLAVEYPMRRFDAPATAPAPGPEATTTVAPAAAADVAEVCALLRARLPELALAALDLTEDRLLSTDLSDWYAAAGIERARRVLVQRRAGRVVGVAVCDLGGPAVNVFGLLDQALLVCADDGDAAAAQADLLAAARAVYRAHGRASFHLFLDEGSPATAALAGSGARFSEVTGFMAFSREGVLLFQNFVRWELGRFRRLGSVGRARLDRAAAASAPPVAAE